MDFRPSCVCVCVCVCVHIEEVRKQERGRTL